MAYWRGQEGGWPGTSGDGDCIALMSSTTSGLFVHVFVLHACYMLGL